MYSQDVMLTPQSAYSCPGDVTDAPWWACHSLMAAPTTAYVLDNPSAQNTIRTETVTSINVFNVAYPLQIRWKEGDFVSSTGMAPEPKTGTTPSTTSGGNGNESSEGGLGATGTIILSTVLSVVAILVAVPSAILALRKLRAKRQAS